MEIGPRLTTPAMMTAIEMPIGRARWTPSLAFGNTDLLAGRSGRGGRAGGERGFVDRQRVAILSWGSRSRPSPLLSGLRRWPDLNTRPFDAANPWQQALVPGRLV